MFHPFLLKNLSLRLILKQCITLSINRTEIHSKPHARQSAKIPITDFKLATSVSFHILTYFYDRITISLHYSKSVVETAYINNPRINPP